MGEGLLLVALIGDAADGDDVGAHEGGGREGERGVEGGGGAYVDERKGHGEEVDEDDRVDGNVPCRVDL